MKKKLDRNIIIIIIATILVLGYLVFFNIKKNTKVEIEALVKQTGNNYIVVVDEEDNEYKLETNIKYEIGDKVKAIIKNIKKGTPAKCEVVNINTISKNIEFSITDIPEENLDENNEEIIDNKPTQNNNQDNNSNSITSSKENNTNSLQNETNIIKTEDSIMRYLNSFETEINDSTTLKKSIKEKFVTVVDFIFYDGSISDKTFKELTAESKLKVLSVFLKLDNKIEEKYPNYKDTISTTGNKVYTNTKNKTLELYFDLTTKACEKDQELCNSAKEGLSELKNSFSLTWEFIKEMSGIGINKLKSWYEIWREI